MKSTVPNAPLRTALVGVPLLFLAVAALQGRIDASTRSLGPAQEELFLRSGRAAEKLSLGYNSLLADVYWTRAVQYYGSRVGEAGAKFDLLWPLLDVATTLDPHLIVAYRFGAIFLSEPYAGANRTDLAVKLVKRGIAKNPNEWRLGTDLGLLYYLRLRDYPQASAAYLEASKNPEAPLWLKLMAARIAQKGGSFETSRLIWGQLYQTTTDPKIRENALRQIQSLRAQEDELQLDELADEYAKRLGRSPVSIQDLIAAGLLAGIPVDPSGSPYVIGPEGKSKLNPESTVAIIPPPKIPGTDK